MTPLVLVLVAPAASDGVDVVVPGPARLRVEVRADGRPPGAAWGAFLDTLFDHFDRYGDGTLSPVEAGRVFQLPLTGGREVVMAFAQLDADRDGRGTRTELREFYRRAGFTPVVAVVRPPASDVRRADDALARALDRDGDGTPSRAESSKAPTLLRRFDENEDEVLDPAELLATVPAEALPPAGTAVRVVPPAGGGRRRVAGWAGLVARRRARPTHGTVRGGRRRPTVDGSLRAGRRSG